MVAPGWLVAVALLAGCGGGAGVEMVFAPEAADWSMRSNRLLIHAGTPAADPITDELRDLTVDHPSRVSHEFRARVALQLHVACRHAEALDLVDESSRLHPEAALALDGLRMFIRSDLERIRAELPNTDCQTLRMARMKFLGHQLACLR